jgi:hypothetical protein
MWPWKKKAPITMTILDVSGVRFYIPNTWKPRENMPPGQAASFHGKEGTFSVGAMPGDISIDEETMQKEAQRLGAVLGPVENQSIISFAGRPGIRLILGEPPIVLHYLVPPDEGPLLMATYAFFEGPARTSIGPMVMQMESPPA